MPGDRQSATAEEFAPPARGEPYLLTPGPLTTALSVKEAMVSAIFTETPEGQIELSFRSKPGYDVSKVAFSLGGGGHKQASGATIAGPLEVARARVLPLLDAVVREKTV